ncbi:hypothetical protein Tco_0082967, partial [Tanacetum coccineum]
QETIARFLCALEQDGIFSPYPFSYIHGDEKQLTDFDFEERNPNSWSKAFFDLNSKCASFENGIAESFNRAIIVQRTKPIIKMLEDIRLYIMQRLVEMKTKVMNLEDRITPSIRKRLEILKEQQRFWTTIPSGFQEIDVRKGDQSFGVNLHLKKCMCKLLSESK